MKRISLAALLPLGLCAQGMAAPTIPDLPEPVTNNAVASVFVGKQQFLFSFNGLGKGKTHKDVHAKGFGLKVGEDAWHRLPVLPGSKQGRLASIAVGVGEYAYLFGGYTVEVDHSEVSLPDVYRYHPITQVYQRLSAMPVPVDDSVVVNYLDRYIYLVSGWHNDGNVNLVQMYDIETNQWRQASPFPGKPVFGGAGAIVGNTMVVCDGVKVDYHPEQRRGFSDEAACLKGVIDDADPSRINWYTVDHPDGDAHYRMAAIGSEVSNTITFFGGSDNPYNYNGIGYNGMPSQPSSRLVEFSLKNSNWKVDRNVKAVMDLRGATIVGDNVVVLGGMESDQEVSSKVTVWSNSKQ